METCHISFFSFADSSYPFRQWRNTVSENAPERMNALSYMTLLRSFRSTLTLVKVLLTYTWVDVTRLMCGGFTMGRLMMAALHGLGKCFTT